MKHAVRNSVCAGLLLVCCTVHAWNPTRLAVPVVVNGLVIPYSEFAIYVMPQSPISVGFLDATGDADVTFAGQTSALASSELVAPEKPGLEILEVRNVASGEACQIKVFTLVAASHVGSDQRLNGYRIGSYPPEPLRGLDIYLPPSGYVEVTSANHGARISPNFSLGDFVSKQPAAYPKYLTLRSPLLLKLENILASLNAAGHPTTRLVIMSGYRTPFYNRSIGNVPHSRHVWGGAADFYIDEAPADGRMDDMNNDGRVDRGDAKWLANFVNDMSKRGAFGRHIGGIGVYGSNSAHGPFVHVDVRGTRARW